MYPIIILMCIALLVPCRILYRASNKEWHFVLVTLGTAALLCVIVLCNVLWSMSYWLHDIRPGDRLSAPPNISVTWSDEAARHYSMTVVGPANSGCPNAYTDIGMQIETADLSPDVFSLTVVGRATQWPYRYLVDVTDLPGHDGCVTRVLIDAWYLSDMKKNFKEMGAAGKASRMTREAVQAEAASATVGNR